MLSSENGRERERKTDENERLISASQTANLNLGENALRSRLIFNDGRRPKLTKTEMGASFGKFLFALFVSLIFNPGKNKIKREFPSSTRKNKLFTVSPALFFLLIKILFFFLFRREKNKRKIRLFRLQTRLINKPVFGLDSELTYPTFFLLQQWRKSPIKDGSSAF